MESLKVASLFCGCGGTDVGLLGGFDFLGDNYAKNPMEIVYANDIEESACRIFEENFGVIPDRRDIRTVPASEIPEIDVLTGGFPCQSFSTAGKQKGFEDDRGDLFFQVARVVEATKPKVIFLENVANLLEHDEGKSFLTVYNALAPLGYSFKYQVMEPYEYGNLPQTRARIFIVGFRDDDMCFKFSFPEKIELTQTLGTLFDRSVKHSECYYYGPEHYYYQELENQQMLNYLLLQLNI